MLRGGYFHPVSAAGCVSVGDVYRPWMVWLKSDSRKGAKAQRKKDLPQRAQRPQRIINVIPAKAGIQLSIYIYGFN
jgi:hypothetical protein